MPLERGTTVGTYTIESLLGVGGMGEVYRAHDSRLDRTVALKILPPDLDRRDERVARFEREAKSASALNHPNIVTIHELGSDEGIHFIAMEHVEGSSLREWTSGRRLRWSELVPIVVQIADALAAAHEAGIVHRDLKPDNIMVTTGGRAKILDFGLAKLHPSAQASQSAIVTARLQTAAGTILGTPAYMSPEQIRGETADFRSDQFSLGIIMYELLTGRRPFEAENAMDEVASILNRDAPSLESLSPGVPLPLAWIIARCLEKRPEDRYGSTLDLHKDLSNLASAAPETFARTSQSAHRRRSWPWIAAIGSILVVILAAWLLASADRPEKARPPLHVSIELPPDVSLGTPEILTLLDLSPDGNKLATAAGGRIWIRALDNAEWRPVPGTEGGSAPEWSPDGTSLAFYAEGHVRRVPIDGGPPVDLVAANYNGKPAWSSDGTILYSHIGSEGAGIFAVSESGGEPRQITDQSARGDLVHLFPEMLPDGRRFLYLAPHTTPEPGFEHELRIASLDGAEETLLGAIPSMATLSGDDQIVYAREGTLLRQNVDFEVGRLVGEPEVVSDDLYYFFSTGISLFTCSRSGTIVYQRAPEPSRLVWRNRAGAAIGELGEPARHHSFEISPDGSSVVVATDDPKLGSGDLWLYDLTRATATRLTHASVDELYPGWSADGRRIWFRSDANGPPNIHSIDLTSKEDQSILRQTFSMDLPYEGHPTENLVLTGSISRARGWDIIEQAADGKGEPEAILDSRFNERDATYDPTGRWIAYVADDSGSSEIYVLERASGQRTRISPSGGTSPRWGKNGTELLYMRQGEEIMRIEADLSSGTFGSPEPLFPVLDRGWEWDVTPDGERFLFLSSPPYHATLSLILP